MIKKDGNKVIICGYYRPLTIYILGLVRVMRSLRHFHSIGDDRDNKFSEY